MVFIPTKENLRAVADDGTVNEYFPFMSVITPIVVPFTVTATPGTGPSVGVDEVTVPVMTKTCARSDKPLANTVNISVSKNFFIETKF
jgi:hypothetical protein